MRNSYFYSEEKEVSVISLTRINNFFLYLFEAVPVSSFSLITFSVIYEISFLRFMNF